MEGGGSKFLPDQLDTVVELLKKNPQDRQAVITMWDPVADLGVPGLKDRPCNLNICLRVRTESHEAGSTAPSVLTSALDITVFCRSNDIWWGCLAGDTIIQSPEGDLSISKLVSRFRLGLKRFPVYALDPETGSMAIKWCTKAWKTGIKPVRELVFDDGTSIRLTKDHVLFLKKTKRGKTSVPEECIVQAKTGTLKVGDRIWAQQLHDSNGYLWFKRNVLKNTAYSNRRMVHDAYDVLLNGPRDKGFEPQRWADPAQRVAQSKLMKRLNDEGKLRSNHKIVEIRELPPEAVYDFTVEDYHTALIGSGVVAHNCYGANAVQFSILQEYLAARIGVGIGTYTQISNNYHLYLDMDEKAKKVLAAPIDGSYAHDVEITEFITVPTEFDNDLERFMYRTASSITSFLNKYEYRNCFFHEVAEPMFWANRYWKQKDRQKALQCLAQMPPTSDWRLACYQWCQRRIANS
jgi:hypothetical protein